jgi:lysophospholipase L1-like esterase
MSNKTKLLHLYQLLILMMIILTGCSDIQSAASIHSGEVTLTWQDVPDATVYNVYLSTTPGVTTLNSYKISDVTNPITITDLTPQTTYYFVVTAERDGAVSGKSKEISYKVVNTAGMIQIGDILIHHRISETKNVSQASHSESKPAAKPAAQKPQSASTQPSNGLIVCFGDSLTYGTGASKGMDYPSQLAKMIDRTVINKGLPGDTTASALRRLNRDVLSKNPDVVLITLGGNDLKNGISKDIAFRNLKQIVQAINKQGAKVIIGGLNFPGKDRGYGKGYEVLSQQTGAKLIPNIFTDIFEKPNLMSDPIHPNNSGYRIVARRFYKAIASYAQKNKPKVQASTTESSDVVLAWDDVSNATSYNIYWSDRPGVTKKNGTKISNVKNPHKIPGLKDRKKYYFVVTAVNASGESKESKEFSFIPGQ